MNFDAFRIATGSAVSVTAAVTSISYTIPVSQDFAPSGGGGSVGPRYLRVLPEAIAYINLGQSSAVTANLTNSMLITPNMPEIISVRGYSYFAVIAKTATVVNVTPVEN